MGVRAQEGMPEDSSGRQQDVMVPWVLQNNTPKEPKGSLVEKKDPEVFYRYYHLFVEGELRALVESTAIADGYVLRSSDRGHQEQSGRPGQKWLRIVDVGYEKDNWWLEGEVGVASAFLSAPGLPGRTNSDASVYSEASMNEVLDDLKFEAGVNRESQHESSLL